MNKAVNHINMRLLLILILSILTLAFSFGNSTTKFVFAESSNNIPSVTVQNKTAHRGQTFTIDVDISQNIGLISLFLTVDYDESVMTLKNVIQGNALSSLTLTTTNVDTPQGYGIKPFNILWDGKNTDNTNGTIVTLVFDSFIQAPIGEYPITLTYDKNNTNIAYKTPTDISITNGIVNLIAGEYEAIYRDYDGTILYQQDYNDNDIPEYPSTLPNPTRDEDAEYSYEFIGWKGAVSDNVNVLIFEADYKLTPQTYTVFFYVDGANGYPDGIIDETEDFFEAIEFDFDTLIETPQVPARQYYEFIGWYADAGFEEISTFAKMPAHNISLYGYYSFEIRDRNIPIISLEANYPDNNFEDVVVEAKLVKNTGFNNMVLTLQYDKSVFTFEGFEQTDVLREMRFDTTNVDDLSVDNFKFYFGSAINNYETGSFLKLRFKVKPNSPHKTYTIGFSYDYHTDASYVNNDGEIKYTMIEFRNAEVPVGEIKHWNKELDGSRVIDVISEDGKPINVYLEVELVTNEIKLSDEQIYNAVGSGMYLSSGYRIRLMQNKKEIQPETTLTIRISLTEKEQEGKIKFCYLNDNNELINYDFRIEDGNLVFTTDHLSNWVIFNSYGGYNSSQLALLVGMPMVLALATMLYALRLKQMNRNKKEAHSD